MAAAICTSPDSSAFEPRGLVGNAEQLDLVEIGLARLEVLGVAHADRLDAGLELLAAIGAGADRRREARRCRS